MFDNLIQIFLAQKFPYTSSKNYAYKNDPKKIKKFKLWSILSILIALLYLFATPVFYTALISKAVALIYRTFTPEDATYYPSEWLMYFLIAIPLSFATLMWLHRNTLQLFLQDEYEEFEDYYNTQQMYDNNKAGKFFTIFGLILTLISIPFVLSSRVIVYSDYLTVKQFYDITAHSCKYSELQKIAMYEGYQDKAGVIHKSDFYKINFQDGYTFAIGTYVNDTAEIVKIVNDISTKGNVPIENLGIIYWEE